MECLRVLSVRSGGESARIYIRQGGSRVCVAQHEGTQQLRHVVRIGEEMPLWAGASGHVLLIGGSARTLSRVAAAAGRGPDFASVLAERARLAAERGFAVSHGERADGVSAVAAPVTDAAGQVVAAVGLGGPTSRFTEERVESFCPALAEAAKRLSELGFLGGSG
ncbi:hypothetical protein SVIO_037550 [Streptomyces violaceusniger]|uniref:IclR-ED domain-containing protein n=1 Tax=Streptomyces violaceusniger TaxID=68280 RepID=A0A4D4KWJ3_STRVO|nr:hypothetical protein SVIO_037550 [Streptomyces violaceusniger]